MSIALLWKSPEATKISGRLGKAFHLFGGAFVLALCRVHRRATLTSVSATPPPPHNHPPGTADHAIPTWVSTNSLFQRFPRLLLLERCKSLHDLHVLHSYTIISGLFNDPFVASRILRVACTNVAPPCLAYASLVFARMGDPNVFSWNTMIRALACSDQVASSFVLYQDMLSRGVVPDRHTYTFLLSACGPDAAGLRLGRLVHAHALVMGFHTDPFVQTALMTTYFACGCLRYACLLFDRMAKRDVVSWTAMISGLTDHGCCEEALLVFNDMRRADFAATPNVATVVSAMSACAGLGSLDHARALHAYAEKVGLVGCAFVSNSLIDVYAKCGSTGNALEIFGRMNTRDLHSWTSLITGLALQGSGPAALDVFARMKQVGPLPDSVTFLAVLSACSHSGLVDEGRKHFASMVREYNVEPHIKHYGCMIDLLSRAGLLLDAYKLIVEMPLEPNSEMLGSLLSACRVHNNLQLGEIIAKKITYACGHAGGAHVLLSNMYANENRWDDVVDIRKKIRKQGVKPSGRSWIEVNGVVHEFFVEDRTNWHNGEIDLILDGLMNVL